MPEIRIGSTFDAKGFREASKSTSALEKNVKKLGVSLAAVFSARAIVNFGRAAVRASLQQQAEQDRLNQLLTVGVGATSSQIAALNDQAEALEKLGVVTAGNITQTQSQLATFNLQTSTIEKLTPAILDYVTAEKGATASTEQFKQMTNGLAQALNGNFTSLTRVGFVIDENTKKQIKSGNESERAQAIVDVLNSTYKDFNKNLRETPAGQMQILANAAEDAQTIIGEGLIDSLMILAGDNTVDELAISMQEFATSTSEAIVNLGKLLKAIKAPEILQALGITLGKLTTKEGLIEIFTPFGEMGSLPNADRARRSFMGGSGGAGGNIETPQERAQRIKRENEQKRLAANLLAAENKRLKSERARVALAKAQLALGKASKTLDLERIGIEAALKGQISETDRLSLNLQKAILDENASLATQLAAQLEEAVRRQNELKAALLATPEAPNPYRNWKAPDMTPIVGPVAPQGIAPVSPSSPLAPRIPVPDFTPHAYSVAPAPTGVGGSLGLEDLRGRSGAINVTVVLNDQEIGNAIRDVSVNDSLSGSFNTVNRTSRFAPEGVIPA
jgi:hypothetical protein